MSDDRDGGADGDVDVAAAIVDALLAQLDALIAAIARAPSTKAKHALTERKAALEREVNEAKDSLVRLASREPPRAPMAAPFGPAAGALDSAWTAHDGGEGDGGRTVRDGSDHGADKAGAPARDELDDPSTDENALPFDAHHERAGSVGADGARGDTDGDSSVPDTVEVRRPPSTSESQDSQRLVLFARSIEGESPLGPDSRLVAGAGLHDLRGAPDDVREIAAVLCAAVDAVRVKDLQPQTSLTMERLLMALRRLMLLKLVERAPP